MRGRWCLLALLSGCSLLAQLEGPPERPCDARQAFWPDEDGDGVGDDDGRMYVGCEAPTGWVTVPPEAVDSGGSDSGDSAD